MAVDFKDYYSVLGVSRSASADEIKQAFRKLARKYHPDVAKDKKAAEEKFKEINEANEVLSDPEKRRKYDELGADWQNAQNGQGGRQRPGSRDFNFGGSTGFSDFFEQFFGGRARTGGGFQDVFGQGRTRGGAEEYRMPGSDIEGDILVTLEESLRGSSRKISLQHTNPETGEGETETFTVRIPPGAGAVEGRRIRVRGKGGPGAGGAERGDLFLRVRLASHPDFEPRGADLYHELDLAPWEAVLGAHVTVPTLSGRVKLTIPPGTNGDRQFRLRGQGLPTATPEERGDLYVIAKIKVPSEVNTRERKTWEELAKISEFKPRED